MGPIRQGKQSIKIFTKIFMSVFSTHLIATKDSPIPNRPRQFILEKLRVVEAKFNQMIELSIPFRPLKNNWEPSTRE